MDLMCSSNFLQSNNTFVDPVVLTQPMSIKCKCESRFAAVHAAETTAGHRADPQIPPPSFSTGSDLRCHLVDTHRFHDVRGSSGHQAGKVGGLTPGQGLCWRSPDTPAKKKKSE